MDAYQPGAFWFSKISDSRKCMRYYKLKHLDGIKVPQLPAADLEFGTAMHLAINECLENKDGYAAFMAYWGPLEHTPMQPSRYSWGELAKMADVFVGRFERLHKKHFEPFKMEERIHAELGGHAFEGTPDFLGGYKGIPSIVDFKTAAYRYDKNKLICDEQMPGYAALAEKALGYKVEQRAYIVFIKSATDPSIQTLISPLTYTQTKYSIDNVLETCDDLVERKRFPRNTSACLNGTNKCPYWSVCFNKESE